MNSFFLLILQCGSFILIPTVTFGMGLWLIGRYFGLGNHKSYIFLAILIGFSFFEASTIGMLIDPRGGFSKISEILKTSSIIGVIVGLLVLVFVPIYRGIIKLFE